MERTSSCRAKCERMRKALHHQEPDRVPISDSFWGSFLERWRREMDLPADADIYRYYDLDWMVTIPNMDPHIKNFEIFEQTHDYVLVKTGFEAVIKKVFNDPMPAFLSLDTNTIEKMAAFQFDDPCDDRRYFAGGDNQVAGIGDSFSRDSEPWISTVKRLYPDFSVYGSVCEAHEMLWRIIGSENVLMWIGLYPDEVGRFVERLGAFCIGMTEAQIKAAGGLLDGMVIWGDVAYRKDLFFSPEYWRKYFKPVVKAMVEICREHGLPVIYHGCGNINRIFTDFIDIQVDALNPLEYKAELDVLDLRRRYGHRMAFCGNMDVKVWADGSEERLREVVLTKLNAAKGGGLIFQSDHSVPDTISAQRYEQVLQLVRRYGQYPLELGRYDRPEIH